MSKVTIERELLELAMQTTVSHELKEKLSAALQAAPAQPVNQVLVDAWKLPNAHRKVMEYIRDGYGGWYGAERPKQRGHRSGLLKDLKCHEFVAIADGQFALTDAGRAALAQAQAQPAQGLTDGDAIDGDVAFEDWWQCEGQFHRAGGGDYEKTFAYHAWQKSAIQKGQQS